MPAPTPHSEGHLDTASLSMRLLVVVREVAQSNRTEAQMRFGLDEPLLDALLGADVAVLEEICLSGKLAFKPTFGLSEVQQASLRAGTMRPAPGKVK